MEYKKKAPGDSVITSMDSTGLRLDPTVIRTSATKPSTLLCFYVLLWGPNRHVFFFGDKPQASFVSVRASARCRVILVNTRPITLLNSR